ncbi:MAG: cation-translocating P-type ATPase [Phycisphaerales bacterium]|jgi:Ca2+-transporting ATPase|nr:cation-translocating P-type ATPase [Phycisphaerales bacterium]
MNKTHHNPQIATGDSTSPGPAWHGLSADDAIRTLGSDARAGLSAAEAAARLQSVGPNTLTAREGRSWWAAFGSQFAAVLVWLLLVAAGVSAVLGEWVDAGAIAAIIVINAVIGASQEHSAERSIAALRGMTAPKARVVRGGVVAVVPAARIVPGDVLVLEAGDLVAADARLIESASLAAIEKSLTGESEPAEKDARAIAAPPPADTPLAERSGMVYSGTAIATGTARAVVVATGMRTEMGRIAALIATAKADGPTPLQARLARVGRLLVVASLVIVAGLFGLGLIRGEPLLSLFMTAVSMAVAAVPEGLPAIVTVALALGVRRMARRRALIRHLPAVETLGATSVICTDKTGTLTVGQMTARALVVPVGGVGGVLTACEVSGEGYAPHGAVTCAGKELIEEVRAAAMRLAGNLAGMNNATVMQEKGHWEASGDPTEAAMLIAAAKIGLTRESLDGTSPRLAEAPFDSDRKRAAVVRKADEGADVLVNGSPESVLALCTQIAEADASRSMTAADRAAIDAANAALASKGLRVLACAARGLPQGEVAATVAAPRPASLERDLTFVGLVGLLDPPRAEAREAVARCKAAGIRVVMITGDQPRTALAIARDLGIASESDAALSGAELGAIDDAALPERVGSTAVYARVTAADKLRIVRAWREQGAVVAMTGDGVNDAPALKGADVGIAMGASGTEVARQASDMVITDDNFASIVAAVEEGRGVYDNIKKSMQFLLGGNAAELLYMGAALVAGLPTPLLPIQILWINLVTDGLPALFLAADPAPPGVMERSPRPRNAAFIDRAFVGTMILTAFLTAGVALGVYLYGLKYHDETTARTHAFAALVFAELLRSFGARSETVPIWRMGWRDNAMLLVVVAASFGLQVWTHHNQTLSSLMKTSTMGWEECIPLMAVSCIPLAVLELVKVLRTTRKERG